jgi:hypothetical protein
MIEYGNPFCFCAAEPELGAYQTGEWCHRMAHVQRDHLVRLTILALSRLALSRQLAGDRLHNLPPLGRLTRSLSTADEIVSQTLPM